MAEEKTHRFPFEERSSGVRKLREELKLSQQAVCRSAGISQSVLSRLEAGLQDVSPETMAKIEDALSRAAADARTRLGRLITGPELLHYSLEDFQRDSEANARLVSSPAYQRAIGESMAEMQGEIARLRYYLAQTSEAVEKLQEMAQAAVTAEGGAILESATEVSQP